MPGRVPPRGLSLVKLHARSNGCHTCPCPAARTPQPILVCAQTSNEALRWTGSENSSKSRLVLPTTQSPEHADDALLAQTVKVGLSTTSCAN